MRSGLLETDNSIRKRNRGFLEPSYSSHSTTFLFASDSDVNKMTSKYKGLKITSGRRKLHCSFAILFVTSWILLYYLTTIAFHTLPEGIRITENDDHTKFVAERSQRDLFELTNLGPRVVGSSANEQSAMNFLIKKVNDIILESSENYLIETDGQVASGSYAFGRSANTYQAIQNYIVKVTPKTSINNNCSLLINSHFDTVSGSPGAGDDGTMVVVMLEILRILTKSMDFPKHSIVFLFNGAEENPLQGSHAFITQHKWASNVKAFINLDSAGNGGKEVLFQSGPNHPWLMKYYKNHAYHPYASTTAEELFQKGFIPSDTDFRIFRDFGNIPGLDFAHSYNDYVYHTKYDRFETIPLGTLQNTGDNILAMVKALASAPELENTSMYEKGHAIFFDFMNLFLVLYTDDIGIIVNISICAIAVVLILVSFYCMSDNSGVSFAVVLGQFSITFILQLLAVFLASSFTLALAFILDAVNLSLSWFSQPWLIGGLYISPLLFGLAIIPISFLHFTRQNKLLLNHRIQMFLHAQCLILVILVSILTSFGIRSAFLPMIAVVFYTISLLINLSTTLHNKQLLWLIPHTIGQILPFIFFSYQSYAFFTSLIPMAGRSGPDKNPELLICIGAILYGVLMSGFLIPLCCIFRKSIIIANVFLVCLIVFIIVALTPLGFPYTSATAPQRFQVLHTKRTIHMESKELSDSGYFIFTMDRNGEKTIKDYIPNSTLIRPANEYCGMAIYCGIPVYNYRNAANMNNVFWIPADKPNLIKEPKLRLLSKTVRTENIVRYNFELTGPDHMSIMINPLLNVSVVGWSFASIPFDQWEPPYYSYFSYGTDSTPLQFYVDYKTAVRRSGPISEIAVSGHLNHHNLHNTEPFSKFLESFPKWTYVQNWISSYENWIL